MDYSLDSMLKFAFRLLFLVFLLNCSSVRAELDAYLSNFSVAQNSNIQLFVNTDATSYDLKIIRFGLTNQLMLLATGLTGIKQVSPQDAYKNNPGWIEPQNIVIPSNWPSALFYI